MLLIRRIVAALLLGLSAVSPAGAQALEIGATQTFEVGTWNIEWLGSPSNGPSDDPLQLDNAVQIISESAVDLWALQEINDPATFDALLAALGADFDGRLTIVQNNLLLGFVYRLETIRLRRVQNVLTSFSSAFAGRPPLKLEVDVTLPDTTMTVVVLNVHMKARSDLDSYNKRVDASNRLKTHIDFALSGQPVIVAGDFNDELTRSIYAGRTSPYQNFLADDRYTFLTGEMESEGIGTFCGSSISCTSSSTIDHIMATDEFLVGVQANTARLEAALDAINRFVFTTSDHIPVVARMSAASSVAREAPPSPTDLSLAVYPNPAWDRVTVKSPGAGRIRVLDMLGRTVLERELSGPNADVQLERLTAGLYLIEWTSPSNPAMRTTMLIR